MTRRCTIGRRACLRGGLAAIASGAVGLPWTQAQAGSRSRQAHACIFLFMRGGQSQLDTWDPKPGRETGGPVEAIRTATSGLRISEHLPRMARLTNHLTVIRSLHGSERNHENAHHLLHTSYPPQLGAEHPPLASIVARDWGDGVLPGYIAIRGRGHAPGLLGPRFMAFEVPNPLGRVPNLSRFRRVDDERFGRRLRMWRDLEDAFAAGHAGNGQVLDRRLVWEQAIAMMGSHVVEAFDLSHEPEKLRERYGRKSRFGQGCLLARRLVERGAPFVEVHLPGWDTHRDNFSRARDLCRDLDGGFSALLEDLAARGLLARTMVVCVGEFGRSPKINEHGGRGHYPKAFSAVVAGGGVPGGQVIGSTDEDGVEITQRPVSVVDLLRTIAVKLGTDPDEVHESAQGRPIATIDGGSVIAELG